MSGSAVGEGTHVEANTRFPFGRNWSRFLRVLDLERIHRAEESLRTLLRADRLAGKRFLDVGSGSGLLSLAAWRLGAQVCSFDVDPEAVGCTSLLQSRYAALDSRWAVRRGSVLDQQFLATLGSFDVVYAWGALHHTGAMWQALGNVIDLMGRGGLLCVAIYNNQGWISTYWRGVKRLYNRGLIGRSAMIALHAPYLLGARLIYRALAGRGQLARGMAVWYDMLDWLGGYPFEVATPNAVIHFCGERGLALLQARMCGRRHGCNEFVFHRVATVP